MKVGDRIYYTGDMANGASEGTITACNPATKYSPESVDIKFDESRFEGDKMESKSVYIQNFSPGIGCRFWMLENWYSQRKAALKAFQEKYARKEA